MSDVTAALAWMPFSMGLPPLRCNYAAHTLQRLENINNVAKILIQLLNYIQYLNIIRYIWIECFKMV